MTDAKKPEDLSSANGFTPPTKVLGREAKVVRKRFYKQAAAGALAGGFTVLLDGRGVKTPGKAALVVPVLPLAEALADEWASQGEDIKPSTMPLTTLACTAIDAVAPKRAEVADEIGRYASSDHLCYRADAPAGLVALQTSGWDPVLTWASSELGVTFKRGAGIMPVEQSPDVAEAMVAALTPLDPLRLASMHILTSLMGSALLALAVLRRHTSLVEAWRLAHLDEQWQIDRWGTDDEAEVRQAARLRMAVAAAQVLEMVGNKRG